MLNTLSEIQLELFEDEASCFKEDISNDPSLSTFDLSQNMALQESQKIYQLIEKFSLTEKTLEKEFISQNLQKILFDKCLEAQRWNSFKNCYQMKLVGWSGIDDNTKAPKGFSHVHIEAWTCHHEATLTEHQKINNTVMTKFADNATYSNFVKPKYFKERKK